MNLFDLSLLLNGFPIGKAKRALQELQGLSEDAFKTSIEARKKEVINYHLQHNPFYRDLTKNADLSSWEKIPVMTKRDLQQPLTARLSSAFSVSTVYVNKTSGSSGTPFIFAKDNFCHAMTWAVIQNRFGWYGLDFNSSLQARFYGIPLDKKGFYKERIKDIFSKRMRFSIFDLSDPALERVLAAFRKHPFEYLNGYTSSIVQFAKFLKRKGLVLKPMCPTLKCCVVTSEMLFEADKELMETQFGIPVVNEYGASELDLIAFQNPHDEWQMNSETLFVEILDENDRPVPNGEEGRVVITSLYNRAHPFIRYDIGDIAIRSKESTPQKPLLEKLIGRTNDIAILPSGKKAAGLTFYYITKSMIEEDGLVKEFVIEQLALDTFKVFYVSDTTLSEERVNYIKTQMETYLESGLHIIFERTDRLIRSKSGKLRQFSSFVKETP